METIPCFQLVPEIGPNDRLLHQNTDAKEGTMHFVYVSAADGKKREVTERVLTEEEKTSGYKMSAENRFNPGPKPGFRSLITVKDAAGKVVRTHKFDTNRNVIESVSGTSYNVF
jgi:hypothetical protein